MFSKLYFETTVPETPYKRLFSIDVIISIVFHVILYTIFLYLLSLIFNLKLSYDKYKIFILIVLVIIIFVYPIRLFRFKSLNKTLLDYGFDKKLARQVSVDIGNNAYYTWYFLG